jgi:hypothetical protein
METALCQPAHSPSRRTARSFWATARRGRYGRIRPARETRCRISHLSSLRTSTSAWLICSALRRCMGWQAGDVCELVAACRSHQRPILRIADARGRYWEPYPVRTLWPGGNRTQRSIGGSCDPEALSAPGWTRSSARTSTANHSLSNTATHAFGGREANADLDRRGRLGATLP